MVKSGDIKKSTLWHFCQRSVTSCVNCLKFYDLITLPDTDTKTDKNGWVRSCTETDSFCTFFSVSLSGSKNWGEDFQRKSNGVILVSMSFAQAHLLNRGESSKPGWKQLQTVTLLKCKGFEDVFTLILFTGDFRRVTQQASNWTLLRFDFNSTVVRPSLLWGKSNSCVYPPFFAGFGGFNQMAGNPQFHMMQQQQQFPIMQQGGMPMMPQGGTPMVQQGPNPMMQQQQQQQQQAMMMQSAQMFPGQQNQVH